MAFADLLDKTCDIYSLWTYVSKLGETRRTWNKTATLVPCALRLLAGDWGVSADRLEPAARVKFYLPPDTAVYPGDALVCEGQTYITLAVTKMRRHHLEVTAEVRGDVSLS